MKINVGEQLSTTVYLVPEGTKLEMISDEAAQYALNHLKFKGNLNEKFIYLGPNTDNIVVVGLGHLDHLTKDHYVQAAYTAAKILNEQKVESTSVQIKPYGTVDEKNTLQGITEGFLQADYSFDTYKKEKTKYSLTSVSLLTDLKNAQEAIEEVRLLLEAVNVTRDLVNTPANDLYPETLANKVTDLFKDTDVQVEIFDKQALEELGAKALLAVSQGSSKEPRMLVLKYLPLGDEEPVISLVGKGVTYDSGGYAIKSAKGMSTMKTDMAGAGAMIGALHAIVSNNIQQNVVCVIGATENLISGEAFKNGDIIHTLKGTTIEVINTDAEGRLVLADVLYYAATKLNSKYIIDAATLTGAVIAALGQNITGTMTNDQSFLDKVTAASKTAGEDMWQLPITPEFREKIKGNHADLINSSINFVGAGTIFAAAFLEHFVEDVPWVHLDIAGTSYASSNGNKYLPKGASGIPVKTLYEFVKNVK